MQRLSGLDAAFLYLETPSTHMHVGLACTLDPSTSPGGWSFGKVRGLVENRLPLIPPFRRRLVRAPFGLHHPVWVDDPDFDLDYHLRRACLPSPGGDRELVDFIADVMGRPLDKDKPLWEMYVVEGLEGGRVACVSKIHHAASDGVSGAELAGHLLDLGPDSPPLPPEPWEPDRLPDDLEVAAAALGPLSRQPVELVRTLGRSAEVALQLARLGRSAPPVAPFSGPRVSFNATVTPHRRLALGRLPRDRVKEVKRGLGGTVNDVVLAACAGGLRRYLDERGELPGVPLVALVPISVRTHEQHGELGNRVSGMLVSLATDEADPVARLELIAEGAERGKERHEAIGAGTLQNWAELTAPAAASGVARLVARTRIFDRVPPPVNVVISNVPGPAFPLYLAGARLDALYPMGPVTDGVGLNITVMSYHGTMYLGLLACRELVPQVDRIARAVEESLDELVGAAGRRQGAAGRRKRAAGGSRPGGGRAEGSGADRRSAPGPQDGVD